MKRYSTLTFLALGLLSLSLGSVIGAGPLQGTKPFVGTWNGAISAGGMDIEIILKFSADPDTGIAGTINVPSQFSEDIALGEVTIEGKKISFIIDHPNVQGDPTFIGELDETGKKISGSFSQGGVEGTFSVEKEE